MCSLGGWWEIARILNTHLYVDQAVLFPADVGTLSAGNADIWQEISMNLYKLIRICNKHYSFPSTVSLTASLMCFIHFRMSINVNVQVMPQMYIFLTGNFSTLSRVRRKQQINKRPANSYKFFYILPSNLYALNQLMLVVMI